MMQTKRDGMDYKSMYGVTHMLNNAESVLQRNDVKDAIDGYEELFTGARKEVRWRSCSDLLFVVSTRTWNETLYASTATLFRQQYLSSFRGASSV